MAKVERRAKPKPAESRLQPGLAAPRKEPKRRISRASLRDAFETQPEKIRANSASGPFSFNGALKGRRRARLPGMAKAEVI
jgi:hypothetical protein